MYDIDYFHFHTFPHRINTILTPLMDTLLVTPEFKETGTVLNEVLDILNDYVLVLENSSFTLNSAVHNIPLLKDLFDSLGLNSNMLQTILMAPIQNATAIAEMFLSENFMSDFCKGNRWNILLSLPSNFDTSPLYSAMCQGVNVDQVLSSLRASMDMDSLINAMAGNATGNMESVGDKMSALFSNIDKLMINPPSFTSDAILDTVFNSYSNEDNLWQMLSSLSALQAGFDSIDDSLGSLTRISKALVDFLQQLMARLEVQNGRLDLASLFDGVPEVTAIVNGFLGMSPDPISGLMAVQLDFNEVGVVDS